MFSVFTSDHCDLDLKSCESKIYRGHVPTNTNQHVTYDISVINSFKDIDQKPFGLQTDGPTNQPTY